MRGLATVFISGVCLACGSRSGLDDACLTCDAGVDAYDAMSEADAQVDAKPEAGLPLPWASDAGADLVGCDTQAPTVAYLVSQQGDFYTYDPPSGKETLVGHLPCNDDFGSQGGPYVMTVSRERVAYIAFDNGLTNPWKMFRFDIATSSCQQVAFIPPSAWNIGIAMSRANGAEWMYVVDEAGTQVALYRADPATFVFSEVGNVGNADFPLDLQADAYDRLFGYSVYGKLYQIDATTGAVVAEQTIPSVGSQSSWTLLPWGASLYLFNGDGQSTAVRRLDLATHAITMLPPILGSISGASAPPCVP